MSYLAQIAKLEDVRPHGNADRLKLANVGLDQVIVGLEANDGDIGVFFAEGGRILEPFLTVNDLVRRKDENGNPAGGMFDANGKVRAQKFRGERSDGFWIPLDSLEKAVGKFEWTEGMIFDELNGTKICEKYLSPKAKNALKGGTPATKRVNLCFKEHVDTIQLRHADFFVGDLVWFSDKIHGTSSRFGYVKDSVERQSRLRKLLRLSVKTSENWTHLIGTRRTILKDDSTGFYGSEDFRRNAVAPLIGKLHKGETIYQELCGYTDTGALIMGEHDTSKLKDKEVAKLYGNKVAYTYGAKPGETVAFCYRITMTNEDGVSHDLSWPQVVGRCEELDIKVVPYDHKPWYIESPTDIDEVRQYAESICGGQDSICPAHPKEGVVLRIERANGKIDWVKNKSFLFKCLEGLLTEDENFVDREEVS